MALATADDFNVSSVLVAPKAAADDFNVPGNFTLPKLTGFFVPPLHLGMQLFWDLPAGTVLDYTVTATSGGRVRTYTLPGDADGSVHLSGLINDLTWNVSIVYRTADGTSAPATADVVPSSTMPLVSQNHYEPNPGIPDPPVLNAVSPGDESLQAQWTPAVWDGGSAVLSWIVLVDGLPHLIPDPSAITGNVVGLANDVAYPVQVIATNALGDSAVSNTVSATPADGLTSYQPPVVQPPVTLVAAPPMIAFRPQNSFAPGHWAGVTGEVRGPIKQLALAEIYQDPSTGIARVSDSFPITPSCGVVWYTSVDFGTPNVRESSQENPQADGVYDTTQFTGARQVSIEGVVLDNAYGDVPADNGWDTAVQWNSASWFTSLLSAWASPARRYRLYWTDEVQRSRFMDVRGDSFTSQIDKGSAGYRTFQLNMVNPAGRIYSLLSGVGTSITDDGRHTVPIRVSGAEAPGRVYPEPGPYLRNYPALAFGYDSIRYQGTTPNGCVVEVNSGSSTLQSPRVTFTAPNGSVSSVGLAGVTIASHTTLSFDTSERTVTTRADNSATVVNVERYLDAPLVWPRLHPGINLNAPTTQARSRGYNKVGFSSSPAAATDATMTVLFHEADLL